MVEVLVIIPIVLITAFSFNELFKRIGFPPVVGQILGGIILGIPVLKTLLFGSESLSIIDFLSILGIVFLLFLVGLEIDIKKIKESSRDAILISFSSAAIPFFLGFFFLRAAGYDLLTSIIFGGALSVTAEGTKVRVLMDLNVLNTRLGAIMISAYLFRLLFRFLNRFFGNFGFIAPSTSVFEAYKETRCYLLHEIYTPFPLVDLILVFVSQQKPL